MRKGRGPINLGIRAGFNLLKSIVSARRCFPVGTLRHLPGHNCSLHPAGHGSSLVSGGRHPRQARLARPRLSAVHSAGLPGSRHSAPLPPRCPSSPPPMAGLRRRDDHGAVRPDGGAVPARYGLIEPGAPRPPGPAPFTRHRPGRLSADRPPGGPAPTGSSPPHRPEPAR